VCLVQESSLAELYFVLDESSGRVLKSSANRKDKGLPMSLKGPASAFTAQGFLE
jgi:hypothetical protein